LIEADTVSVMPLQTLLAFYDHGKVRHRLSEDTEGAEKVVSELRFAGIDYGQLVPVLENEELKREAEVYSSIVKSIDEKGKALHEKRGYAVKYSLSGFEAPLSAMLDEIGNENFLERLWAKDPSIWKKGPEEKKLIKDALGWLTLPDIMDDNKEAVVSFAEGVKKEGFTKIVLLGMGGSSLAPLVFSEVFGSSPGYPELIVLDSTDPDAIRSVTRSIDPLKTLFIVSSKSGSTIEPLSLFEYFYGLLFESQREAAGRNFMAITDPGTPLEGFARKYRFKKIFINPHDIGGRFSALSYFGLVPAALIGVDISKLLHHACNISAATHPCIKEKENPVVMLGAALGILGRSGRDKATFFLSKEMASFGLWIEQLIAESTGKEGKGLIPIVNEPPGSPEDYDDDRVFIHISAVHEDRKLSHALKELASAGHPVISFNLRDPYELGGEFLRWEVATAVAGQVLGINPFDQPDVELAKRLTRARLHAIDKKGALPPPGVEVNGKRFRVFFGKTTFEKLRPYARGNGDLRSAMKEFFGLVRKGDYLGLLAYFDPSDEEAGKSFAGLRKALRDSTKAATQFGYGPRYLHSTGQLHKGGANKGVFIIICHQAKEDIPIPKSPYTFSELELSQAFGDMEALDSRGCRVALLELKDSSLESLAEAEAFIKSALQVKV
ncbi:MAG: transaldolase, partial [Deltaproteobacteria bacterium]|nr:transaldolase [Deltaproteobacteria bacterium]